ncbi:MAG: C40 family peptidase [Bacteroidales bacterium]|nr:C40 family peptidase [Bacteroidales bacterium]
MKQLLSSTYTRFKAMAVVAVTAVLGLAPAAMADEPFQVSDRLAYNMDIDPTSAFLFLPDQEESTSERDELVSDILSYAKSYLGRPYRSGSKGPKAFDCSGFTSYVFKAFDIQLKASSGDQYTQGEKIDVSEIRPGDLVFFGGRGASKTRVGHVGLAVDVDENGIVTFIHAATSAGIRFDKYPDGGYYSKRFIGARRVIE